MKDPVLKDYDVDSVYFYIDGNATEEEHDALMRDLAIFLEKYSIVDRDSLNSGPGSFIFDGG